MERDAEEETEGGRLESRERDDAPNVTRYLAFSALCTAGINVSGKEFFLVQLF